MDFTNADVLRDSDYEIMTGVSKINFSKIVDICEKGRNLLGEMKNIPLRNTIALLLVKLRLGCSNAVLSSIFSMSKSGVNEAITRARKIMMDHFVPKFLGNIL